MRTAETVVVTRGGGGGNRTRVQGFAGPCLSHSATPPEFAKLRANQTAQPGFRWRCLRADDGIRTRDPHLGKVMRYQLRYVRDLGDGPGRTPGTDSIRCPSAVPNHPRRPVAGPSKPSPPAR